ncbi:four helix bundle protein [Vibrio parahaemolyticus]
MKFEQLEVWKWSSRLANLVYAFMRDRQDYVFKDQTTRSALSIPSYIAEGLKRNRERRSAVSQTYIGRDIGYIDLRPSPHGKHNDQIRTNPTRTS